MADGAQSRNAHAVAFNALTRALGEKGEWVPLSVRLHATDKVLAALDEAGALGYEPFVVAGPVEHVIDMGFLSLPAELQAEAEPAITPAVPRTSAAPVTFHEPDEPVADVQAAFEVGEKGVTGQPTALVTVDLADLLTALNQRTGHSHMRPGVWDASNPPWRANLPCVECAARERLRAALATAAAPLPPASNEMREHPGHDVPTEGIPAPADGVERTYDLDGRERTP